MYVCSCFGITEEQVREHAESGACTPRQIAARSRAGTDCGSCVRRIQGLLGRGGCPGRAARLTLAAEPAGVETAPDAAPAEPAALTATAAAAPAGATAAGESAAAPSAPTPALREPAGVRDPAQGRPAWGRPTAGALV